MSPQGLKANMKRLYQLITEQQFSRCHKQDKYKKLLFSLCFFHSVLLERRKFLMLGWNIQYGFNDSDFEVSENLLSIYLDEYEETPWDALKYLVSLVLRDQISPLILCNVLHLPSFLSKQTISKAI